METNRELPASTSLLLASGPNSACCFATLTKAACHISPGSEWLSCLRVDRAGDAQSKVSQKEADKVEVDRVFNLAKSKKSIQIPASSTPT